MRVMIGTPAFADLLTFRYVTSLLSTFNSINDVDFGIIPISREGDISRARDACADIAMRMGADKLLFIDADIVWQPKDVLHLLESDKKIIGGTYPKKRFPLQLVFNPLPTQECHSRDKKGFEDFSLKYGNEKGEVEVYHLPTGFMLIDMSVFKELAKVCPKYRAYNSETQQIDIQTHFFPTRLGKTKDSDVCSFETEDFAFCSLARNLGTKIYLHSKVILDHVGFHQYSMRS